MSDNDETKVDCTTHADVEPLLFIAVNPPQIIKMNDESSDFLMDDENGGENVNLIVDKAQQESKKSGDIVDIELPSHSTADDSHTEPVIQLEDQISQIKDRRIKSAKITKIFERKTYNCKHCEYTSNIRQVLLQHERDHKKITDNPILFNCDYCQFATPRKHDLKRHVKRHTGERPHQCSVCDYKSIQPGHLRIHMRQHTGEKPYSCTVCPYKAVSSSSLIGHMRSHSGEKNYQCSLCDFKSVHSQDLKRHINTHIGVKQHKCTECDYECFQASNLKRHIRTHTKDRPFKCDVCGYRCKQSGNLKTHMRIHTGIKPYTCKVCCEAFSASNNLQRHMLNHHGETENKKMTIEVNIEDLVQPNLIFVENHIKTVNECIPNDVTNDDKSTNVVADLPSEGAIEKTCAVVDIKINNEIAINLI